MRYKVIVNKNTKRVYLSPSQDILADPYLIRCIYYYATDDLNYEGKVRFYAQALISEKLIGCYKRRELKTLAKLLDNKYIGEITWFIALTPCAFYKATGH